MFQYILAFFLINSCYQSFGKPTLNQSISLSLSSLANQCENKYLVNAINSKIQECNVEAPPYLEKQILCLIFYDISKQLCEAVASTKLDITDDIAAKIKEPQDITTTCKSAQEWVFTNLTEYDGYKNASEFCFKDLVTCGGMCRVGGTVISEVNGYCKYYKWGIDLLKGQVATTSGIVKNIVLDPLVKTKPDAKLQTEKVTSNNQLKVTEVAELKNVEGQIKQTESATLHSVPVKSVESSDIEIQNNGIQKSTALTTSTKQISPLENIPTGVKNVDVASNGLEHPMLLEVNTNEQGNKSVPAHEMKQPVEENDPAPLAELGRDAPSLDAKGIEQVDNKGPADDDYPDSEGNDGGDDDADDVDIKSDKKPEPFIKNKLVVSHESDISQKEFYPNPISDTYSEEGDHFFPFFLTAIILVVLLYVLYHNKSKVSKVFFGLILEGRQGGRRRNSRGHAYRRLDTLEQAMSANTAAPPSKIIY